MDPRKIRLILVRHGETEWNSSFRFQGQTDIPLGDEGRRQASLLAERLSQVQFEKICSSPLSRAYETAAIITAVSSSAPAIVPLEQLSEMCFGDWEGLTTGEVEKKFPDLFSDWRDDPSKVHVPGGESFGDLVERVGTGIRRVISGGERNILAVCHGGTIRAALVSMIGIPVSASWKLRVDNCSITAIDIGPERITLRYSNDTAHLHAAPGLAARIPVQ